MMNSLLWIPILLLAYACNPSADPNKLKFTVSNKDSLSAFSETVYPLLRQNCVTCHSAKISPFFAADDMTSAHDALIQSSKVNLTTPKSSRIYQRLAGDLHNCPSNCEADGRAMLEAITKWAKLTEKDRKLAGIKTDPLGLSGAKKLLPELAFTTVFEAEEGKLSGRMSIAPLTEASGLKTVLTPSVGTHPTRVNTRYGEVKSGCQSEFSSADFEKPFNERPYRVYNKINKFPDANGYTPYYSIIKFYPIHPNKRTQYLQLLKEDATRQLNGEKSQINFSRLSSADFLMKLAGSHMGYTFYINRSPIILPGGLTIEEYHSQLPSLNGFRSTFFSKRFNNEYYAPSPLALRTFLSSRPGLIKEAVYAPLASAYKELLYTGTTPKDAGQLIGSLMNTIIGENIVGEPALDILFDLKYEDADTLIDPALKIHNIDKYVYMEVDAGDNVFTPTWWSIPQFANRDIRYTPSSLGRTPLEYASEYEQHLYNTSSLIVKKVAWYPEGEQATTSGNQPYKLDNVRYLTSDTSNVLEAYSQSRFGELVHPILIQNSCVNCHDGRSNAPAFAVTSVANSYEKSKSISAFNLASVNSSSFYLTMRSGHAGRCGTQCANLAQSFLSAIQTMATDYNSYSGTLQQNTGSVVKTFSVAEQTPGQIKYEFKVPVAGKYKFLARVKHLDRTVESFDYNDVAARPFFHYQIQKADGSSVNLNTRATTDTCSKAVISYPPSDRPMTWLSSGVEYYNLTPGTYTLRIFEGREAIIFDQIGFTQGLNYVPASRLDPTSTIINQLEFDVAKLTGIPDAKFIMNVSEYGNYYKILKPHFKSSQAIWVKDIQVLINGNLNPTDSTFRTIAKVNPADDSSPLHKEPLLVQKQNGKATDTFTIVFQEIRKAVSTDLLSGPKDSRTLTNRVCQDLPYFKANIAPLFKDLPVWPYVRRDGGICDFYGCSTWGMQRTNGAPASFQGSEAFVTSGTNRCISCHGGGSSNATANLKMSPNDEELCLEVIKKVNFDEPASSQVFKGWDGQDGHSTLLFPEKPSVNAQFVWETDATSHNGKKSTWVTGDRLKTYTYSDLFSASCPENAPNRNDRDYLRKFVGTHKRLQFVLGKIKNPAYPMNDLLTVNAFNCLQVPGVDPNTCYHRPGSPTSMNYKKPFQPGDYFCNPSITMNERLNPSTPIHRLDGGDHQTRAPDGMFIQNSFDGLWNPQALSVFLDYEAVGAEPDFTEGSREAKKLIMEWIRREKLNRP